MIKEDITCYKMTVTTVLIIIVESNDTVHGKRPDVMSQMAVGIPSTMGIR